MTASTESVEARAVTASAVRGVAWGSATVLATKVVTFVASVVLIRLVGGESWGRFSGLLALMVFAELVIDMGLGTALVVEQGRGTRGSVPVAATMTIGGSLALVVVGIVVAPWAAPALGLGVDPALFRLFVIYLPLRAGTLTRDAVLQRDLRFGSKAQIEIVRTLVRYAVSLGVALAMPGAGALLIGLLAGEVAAIAWGVRVCPLGLRPRWESSSARRLLSFGTRSSALNILSQIARNSDYLVVGAVLGAVALGRYSVAFRLPELLLDSFLWIVASVALPTLSRRRVAGHDPAGDVLAALRLVSFFGFVVGAALVVLAPTLVPVLFGPEWHASVAPMVLISLAFAISSVGYGPGGVMMAEGALSPIVRRQAPVTFLQVAGYVVAAPHGLVWVAAVHLAAAVVLAGMWLELAHGRFRCEWSRVGGALLPGIVTGVGAAAGVVAVRCGIGGEPTWGHLLGETAGLIVGGCGGAAVSGRGVLSQVLDLARATRETGR